MKFVILKLSFFGEKILVVVNSDFGDELFYCLYIMVDGDILDI